MASRSTVNDKERTSRAFKKGKFNKIEAKDGFVVFTKNTLSLSGCFAAWKGEKYPQMAYSTRFRVAGNYDVVDAYVQGQSSSDEEYQLYHSQIIHNGYSEDNQVVGYQFTRTDKTNNEVEYQEYAFDSLEVNGQNEPLTLKMLIEYERSLAKSQTGVAKKADFGLLAKFLTAYDKAHGEGGISTGAKQSPGKGVGKGSVPLAVKINDLEEGKVLDVTGLYIGKRGNLAGAKVVAKPSSASYLYIDDSKRVVFNPSKTNQHDTYLYFMYVDPSRDVSVEEAKELLQEAIRANRTVGAPKASKTAVTRSNVQVKPPIALSTNRISLAPRPASPRAASPRAASPLRPAVLPRPLVSLARPRPLTASRPASPVRAGSLSPRAASPRASSPVRAGSLSPRSTSRLSPRPSSPIGSVPKVERVGLPATRAIPRLPGLGRVTPKLATMDEVDRNEAL